MPDLTIEQEKAVGIRCYELDWLRVLAVLMLVFYHSAMIFGNGWFHIKNGQSNYVLNLFCRFIEIWHMPLFFLVAGASTWFALEFRTGRQYRLERTRRLIIPLLFGILFLIPPISYFENIQKHTFNGSFLAFYPHFFNGIYPKGNLSWSHLWFVYYLFNFSLVCSLFFPDYKASKKNNCRLLFSNQFGEKRSIYWLTLPIIILEICLRWRFSGFQTFFTDWANVFHYLLIFIYGFWLYSDQSLTETISSKTRQAMWLGIFFSMGYLTVILLSNSSFVGYEAKPTLSEILDQTRLAIFYVLSIIFKVMAEWSILMALIGYGKKNLSNRKKEIGRIARFAFPFYVFHHTIVILIGFYVVQLSMDVWPKYFIISLSAVPLVYVCCELANSNRVTRFMFGIK